MDSDIDAAKLSNSLPLPFNTTGNHGQTLCCRHQPTPRHISGDGDDLGGGECC